MTQRRLRVLMTADTVGGVWTYACELVRALAPLGVDVTLATMGEPPSAAQRAAVAALENAELASSSFALEWMPDPWRDVDAAGDWLLALAARTRPDLVHMNGYAHAALPFGVPVLVVAHSCVVTWFRAVHGTEPPPTWTEYRKRVGSGLAAAKAVAAPTRAILASVLSAYGLQRQGHAIANGRDPSAWRPGSKEPFVLAAGRLWDEAKGLATLDACAPRLAWPVHVAGPTTGPLPDTFEPRGVQMLGELRPDALAAWMARAAIYALPARYEPFGLSILEAALAGCALVVGDLDTLREVWGDAAVFVPPGDEDALAAALAALIADVPRRTQLAARARARALALTPARMAAAYHRLYTEEVCA